MLLSYFQRGSPWGSPGVSPGGCQEDAGEQQGVIDEQNR
jgi:hypothetical protein